VITACDRVAITSQIGGRGRTGMRCRQDAQGMTTIEDSCRARALQGARKG
jgi:hypothetical protein